MKGEFFYIDEAGNPRDEALHAELLESVSGQIASDLAAVRVACAAGKPLSEALKLYASKETRDFLSKSVSTELFQGRSADPHSSQEAMATLQRQRDGRLRAHPNRGLDGPRR